MKFRSVQEIVIFFTYVSTQNIFLDLDLKLLSVLLNLKRAYVFQISADVK